MSIQEIAFWICVLVCLYTLYGYPLLLGLVAVLKQERSFQKPGSTPAVSFIVAAYNEERHISEKLQNLKAVSYPSDKVEFIIGSDASTDKTDDILEEAAGQDSRIRWFRLPERSGKNAVLREAVRKSTGEILIFTDCSVRTDSTIMEPVLSSFTDTTVGLVSSRDVWVSEQDRTPLSQREYIDYEMDIRRKESRLNSLVSVSGSFFAVRKNLFRDYGTGQADDFALPLMVYRQGYKVIHRDDLIGYVPMVKSAEAEIKRRTRIIAAGIRTVFANASLLNPFRYPVFAWQLWSHKVLKWFLPLFLFLSIVFAVILYDQGIVYRIIVWLMVAGAFFAVAGFGLKGRTAIFKPFSTANFFLLSMIAVLLAWIRVASGSGGASWEPSHR
jgi:cellulose synthase/poly-beta-1,6-N-acetylglucosamine synthase-like glycosyltransferase